MINEFSKFNYNYLKGPVNKKHIELKPMEGNCRFAVQYYYYKILNIFIPRHKLLNPYNYLRLGKSVWKVEGKIPFIDYLINFKSGDIIHAEKYKTKTGTPFNKKYKNKLEYITTLHTAVINKNAKTQIYHSTSIEGKSCFWSVNKFLNYYKPIAVKRLKFKN